METGPRPAHRESKRVLQLLVAAAAATGTPATTQTRIGVEIVASTLAPRPGSTLLIGFRMSPMPGWHGYWSNPGESGLAPTVKWTAPPGVHFGPLQHPAPTLLRTMGLVSFVHAGKYTLISKVRLDRSIELGQPLPLTAELSWAACSDKLCVPEKARLSLALVAGDGAPSVAAPLLQRALAQEPRSAPSGSFSIDRGTLVLQLPGSVALDSQSVRFFPDENGFYDPAQAHVEAGPPLRISDHLRSSPPQIVTGVVSDGASAFRLSFRAAEPERAVASSLRSPAPQASAPPPRQSTDSAAEPTAPPSAHEATSNPQENLEQAFALLGIAALAFAALVLARRPYR